MTTHNPTHTGTPQGGIVSPLLSNIGLHGLETMIDSYNNRMGVIRYADDFIITAKIEKEMHEVKLIIEKWLSTRGLTLNPEKTKLIHIKVLTF